MTLTPIQAVEPLQHVSQAVAVRRASLITVASSFVDGDAVSFGSDSVPLALQDVIALRRRTSLTTDDAEAVRLPVGSGGRGGGGAALGGAAALAQLQADNQTLRSVLRSQGSLIDQLKGLLA
jgi:hypothetical protein